RREASGVAHMQTHLASLVEIGRRAKQWLRPLEWWRPDGSGRAEIFQLARHLFARWPVAAGLDGVWMWPEDEAYQGWYVRIGAGGSAWPSPIPYPMTRRQLHFLLQAPAECMLPMGLAHAGVWADARAMGASEDMALRLMDTRLARLGLLH